MLVSLFHKYLGLIRSAACYYIAESLSVFLISIGKVNSMLFYDRISESEGIDANHTCLDTSKECSICHFYFFKDRNFLYQPLVCNGCHNASLCAVLLTDIKIIPVKGKTYRVVSSLLYSDSYCLLESSSLIGKFGTL